MAGMCRNFLFFGMAFLLLDHVACQDEEVAQAAEADLGESGTCSASNFDACNKEQQENIKTVAQLVEEGNGLAQQDPPDNAAALKLYKLALAVDNESEWSANPWINAGLAMKGLGQPVEGLEFLRKGVELNPKLFHGQYNLANQLAEGKQWGEADAAYSAALATAVPNMKHHVLIGYIRMMLSLYHYEDGRSALAGRNFHEELGQLGMQLAAWVKQREKPEVDLVSLCSNVFTLARKRKAGLAFSEWAVKQGIWKDVRQRPSQFSNEMAKGFKATPWWKSDATYMLPDFLEEINDGWKSLQKEFDSLMKKEKLQPPVDDATSDFQWYDKSQGHEWRQLDIFREGQKNFPNAKIAKKAARLFGDTQVKGDEQARVFYSAMMPGTQTIPRCGANNLRITCYLGLRVPNVEAEKHGITVADEVRGLKEGVWACFDDSFEHTIKNDSDEVSGAVVVQFKHPAAPKAQR